MRISAEEAKRRRYRGKRGELNLVKFLERMGYRAKRSAVSGLGRESPDVEGTKPGVHIVAEVKAARTKRVLVKAVQLAKLKRALDFYQSLGNHERVSIVAVKWPYCDWTFVRLTEEQIGKAEALVKKGSQGETVLVVKRGFTGNWRP